MVIYQNGSGLVEIEGRKYCLMLKPCGCCGSDNIRIMFGDMDDEVVCMDCGNTAMCYGDTVEETVWEWNDMNREVS